MVAFSKEACFVDAVIEEILALCFEEDRCILDKAKAVALFQARVDSSCLFFSKVGTFKQAYDLKVALIIDKHMSPIEIQQPSSFKLAHLYMQLLKGTLLDPSVVMVAFSNYKAVGNMPPRVYVLCVMLACLSARRSYNDSILQPIMAGKSSCGKSKIFDSFVSIAKMVNSEASGVGR